MPHSELSQLELLAEIDSLVERLTGWADRSPDWQRAEKCRAMVRRLADRAASLRVRIEAPLVAATLGGTGVGKSALLNAIVGTELVRTGRQRPTTLRPTLVCRPDLTPEMLGIDPASVEVVHAESPVLRDLVLVDCPDPDTTEPSEADHSNLSRLRAILPKCDVLLVVATEQKYRSARVACELAASAPGARLVFVQTHADQDDDIRDDWRLALESELQPNAPPLQWGGVSQQHSLDRIFRIDSLAELSAAQNGLAPRGEMADLMDLLARQMSGAAGCRIRRANFLELAAETLEACRRQVEPALAGVRAAREAIDQQRVRLAGGLAAQWRGELLANRRSWESRLMAQAASRWGFSPFSLLLRIYQGLGGLVSGALLLRARTSAQMALWGAMEGVRGWRARREARTPKVAPIGGFEPVELRGAAVIVEGFLFEAGLPRDAARWPTVAAESESAAAALLARLSADLQSLAARLVQRRAGWFTRFRYELLLSAMLGLLLFRQAKNFFYDSWLAEPPAPIFGLEYYLSAAFWLVVWCVLLLWMFSRRLRRGLSEEISQLAGGWQDGAAGLFARAESECLAAERFCQDLDAIRRDVDQLRRRIA